MARFDGYARHRTAARSGATTASRRARDRLRSPERRRGVRAVRARHAWGRLRARGRPDPRRPRARRGAVRLRVLRPAEAAQRRRAPTLQGWPWPDARHPRDDRVGAARRWQPERHGRDVPRDASGDRAGEAARPGARRRQQHLDERPQRLVYHHNNVAAGTWRATDFAAIRTYEVEGKRLGIVGLGNIGKKVARRVRGFDMDVVYYDILRLSEDQEDALGVRFALLDELLRTSDVVTLHVPLNDVTRGMISTRELTLMKRTAILVNTCRGPVVNEHAPPGAHRGHDRRRRPRRDGGGAAEEEPPALLAPEHHPDAAQRRAHVGQLGEDVPERLRQHPARGGRPRPLLGGAGAAELGGPGLTAPHRPPDPIGGYTWRTPARPLAFSFARR
jgi:hypothetical protein